MITEDELKQLEELEKKATPGPWKIIHGTFDHETGVSYTIEMPGNNKPTIKYADKDLIELTRNILPRLLDGYRSLKIENQSLLAHCGEFEAEIKQKNQVIEKMRESLKNMTRLVDAFRYITTLGKGQSECLEKAKQCLKEVGEYG